MKLYVGFSTANDFVSRAIRWITLAPESHAYLRFELALADRDVFFEAAWDGFRCRLGHQGEVVEEYCITDGKPAQAAFDLCTDWWDTPYDYSGILGELVVRIGMLFGKRWPNAFANPHHMFCSEAAALILKSIGHPLFADVPAADIRSIDPGMLARMLKAYEAHHASATV